MKTSIKKDLHTKTADELKKLIKVAQTAFGALMFEKEQNTLKNTREVFLKRKEIAVLKTILREKEGAK
jgi:ribosomal protein L29